MEILRIGKYAVKITLNPNEAREYKILPEDEFDGEEVKEAFSSLLSKAKEKVDFTYAGRKIFTEIYPSKDGSCEIFISTINDEVEKRVYKERGVKDFKREVASVYVFDSLERLLKVCYRLNEICYKGKSSVYYDKDKKRYYIILEDIYSKDLKYAFIVEYSKQQKTNTISYIKEHYRCVIKNNGVKILSALT